MEDLDKILQQYVLTANSGKYENWDEINSKFPELKEYDSKVLQQYVSTANSGKYENWDEINSKFPELNLEKKKEQTQEEASTEDSKTPATPSTQSGDVVEEIVTDTVDEVEGTNTNIPLVDSSFELPEFKYEEDERISKSKVTPPVEQNQTTVDFYNDKKEVKTKGFIEDTKQDINDILSFGERVLVTSGVVNPEEESLKIEPTDKKDINFTELLPSVQDSHWKSKEGDLISVHRNQYSNTEGFNYNAVPSNGNENAPDKIDGAAVAHFFIMDGRPEGTKDIYDSTPEDLQKESDWYMSQKDFLNKNETDFIPVFSKSNKNSLNVKYKKKSELLPEDNVTQNLIQYNASNIDWNSSVKSTGTFKDGINVLTTKDKKEIKSLPFIEKDKYSRFSGSAAVILFDNNGETISRDFAGSINSIRDEVKSISKDFNIPESEITLGFYDAGSFSAKPLGEEGQIDRSQWSGYNPKSFSGSGIAIPVKVEKEKVVVTVKQDEVTPENQAFTLPPISQEQFNDERFANKPEILNLNAPEIVQQIKINNYSVEQLEDASEQVDDSLEIFKENFNQFTDKLDSLKIRSENLRLNKPTNNQEVIDYNLEAAEINASYTEMYNKQQELREKYKELSQQKSFISNKKDINNFNEKAAQGNIIG